MATKEQERKALEQIAEIIKKIGGADSYIGKAFEGCIDDAQTNIDNDWMNSNYERYTIAENKVYETNKERQELLRKIDNLNEVITEKSNQIEYLVADKQTWFQKSEKLDSDIAHMEAQITAQKERIDAQEQEIITLKAKLYDLMSA